MDALIVDDDPVCLDMIENVLQQMGFRAHRASDGVQALEMMRQYPIHLIITDWEMPRMNGIELCQAVRADEYDGYVYIIMLTGRQSAQQRIEGLYAGADAFITKPVNPSELVVSLKTASRILSLETRDLALFAMAKLAESRDPETGTHIERVQSYARQLAQYLSTTERYHGVVDAAYVRLIYQTSPLHDIGKVGIPDNVLLKPGKLSGTEFAIMKTHTSLGAETLTASLDRFPGVNFLEMARDIAATHHEWWDGTGYPSGLRGEAIPLSGRIVALADVYDALTSKRIYRDAMTHQQSKSMILRERGTHFDPEIVDAFLASERQFLAIRERFREVDKSTVSDDCGCPEAATPEPAPELIKALVVEDDAIVREMLVHFLRTQGIEAIPAVDGAEALALIQSESPRLIVADWEMPKVDGLELCRRLRASGDPRHIHFIMLTMHSQRDRLARAFDVGVDDFLAKPFTEAELQARLRAALRTIGMHDELGRRSDGSRMLNEQLMNLNRRLETLAITDDLTGVFNRRQALLRLEEHWAMAERYGRTLATISVDIDHFKSVNDTHGHDAGDVVLRGVADAMRESVRSTDLVCRMGGEEFVIILPCQSSQEAQLCAERCRSAIEGKIFDYENKVIRVTASFGIAARRVDMAQCSELLKEADHALYAAKQGGRNCVRLAPELEARYRVVDPAA